MFDSNRSEQRDAMSRARLIGIVALIIVAAVVWIGYALKGA